MIVYRDMMRHHVRWHDIRRHPEHNFDLLHVMTVPCTGVASEEMIRDIKNMQDDIE